jgi:hypothetical protein
VGNLLARGAETNRGLNVPLEKQLCILAREFRATRDEDELSLLAGK